MGNFNKNLDTMEDFINLLYTQVKKYKRPLKIGTDVLDYDSWLSSNNKTNTVENLDLYTTSELSKTYGDGRVNLTLDDLSNNSELMGILKGFFDLINQQFMDNGIKVKDLEVE